MSARATRSRREKVVEATLTVESPASYTVCRNAASSSSETSSNGSPRDSSNVFARTQKPHQRVV
jgi:hypothetical protein